MLDDFIMEKKPSSRSVQTPSKGCGTEVKKTQDSTSSNAGKQFPRQSRRREPPGPKWDQNRKVFAQKQNKSAYYDNNRQPKPRGAHQQYYGYGCGKANTQVVVDELSDQFGLVATSPNVGSKKQSLNHLLNFHYAPRGDVMVGSGQAAGGGYYNHNNSTSSSARWLMSLSVHKKHKYNKEQFLQANCQFVVRSDGDYKTYMADPDVLVDWDLIEQIRVLSCEKLNCPICLSAPVAGKITRCGHVFCWSCMLHYLALSDKSWRKCPICYESVHRHDLKSVEILLRATHTIGEEITFRLMKRERGSLIASPVSQYDARAGHDLLSVSEDKLDLIYSKLLTADTSEVSCIIDKEKSELEMQMRENEGCPELCFIEQAMQLLHERRTALNTRAIIRDSGQHISDNSSLSLLSHGDNNNTSTDRNLQNGNGVVSAAAICDLNTASNPVQQDSDYFEKQNTTTFYNSDSLLSPTLPDNCFELDRFDDYCEAAASSTHVNDDNDNSNMVGGLRDEWYDTLKDERTSNEVNVINADTLGAGGNGVACCERRRYISASSTSEGEDGCAMMMTSSITAEDLEILSTSCPSAASTQGATISSGGNKHFYFYQAEDGQQLFLHAVNVRMLEMTYGSLENSPPLLTGIILEKESGSMTDELRKRLRYLQHLPITCQFEVAEISLKPPIITCDTLELFKEQLETRRRRREKRARDERRREKKMVEQVHRQFGSIGPPPRLRIESLHHFPQCGSELPSSLLTSASSGVVMCGDDIASGNSCLRQSSPSSSRASSPVSTVGGSPSSSSTGMSFAQMLREGKSSGSGTWQTNPLPQPPSACSNKMQNDSEPDDNASAAPHYKQSFSEAISSALEQVLLLHDKDVPEESNGNGGGKKKKRKQKKVLLFATGMACNTK